MLAYLVRPATRAVRALSSSTSVADITVNITFIQFDGNRSTVPGRVEIKTSRRWRGCRRDVPKARGETWISAQAAGMKPGQINPFFDPEAKLDKMLLKYAHDILDKTPEEVKLRTMGPSGA